MQEESKKIYIVLSQTGTILSRLLKLITGKKYNHASITFEDDAKVLYSFGRINAYNPFWGGFVQESPEFGTFKRFHKTDALILSLEVPPEKYDEMKSGVEEMYQNRKNYHYNYKGLFLGIFRKAVKRDTHFYCSEFVAYVLTKYGIVEEGFFKGVIEPMDFLSIPSLREEYVGKLKEYKRGNAKSQQNTTDEPSVATGVEDEEMVAEAAIASDEQA